MVEDCHAIEPFHDGCGYLYRISLILQMAEFQELETIWNAISCIKIDEAELTLALKKKSDAEAVEKDGMRALHQYHSLYCLARSPVKLGAIKNVLQPIF
ncbi:hypothetical protein IBT46_26485 [Erwinia sp. S38]|nr:hypothetical protein [Erwinia sp. S38]